MISYAITVHNEEPEYLIPLFDKLLRLKQPEDEIVVVDDCSTNPDTIKVFVDYKDKVTISEHHLNGDFAAHKNYLNSVCKGSYIFSIDADELPHDLLIKVLPEVLMMNPAVDLFTVARINVVTNITPEDIAKWRWNVNEKGYVNFPDRQTRIYKNKPGIRWEGKVHERIVGDMLHADLPEDDSYCLAHIKSIDRQRAQNLFYETLV